MCEALEEIATREVDDFGAAAEGVADEDRGERSVTAGGDSADLAPRGEGSSRRRRGAWPDAIWSSS